MMCRVLYLLVTHLYLVKTSISNDEEYHNIDIDDDKIKISMDIIVKLLNYKILYKRISSNVEIMNIERALEDRSIVNRSMKKLKKITHLREYFLSKVDNITEEINAIFEKNHNDSDNKVIMFSLIPGLLLDIEGIKNFLLNTNENDVNNRLMKLKQLLKKLLLRQAINKDNKTENKRIRAGLDKCFELHSRAILELDNFEYAKAYEQNKQEISKVVDALVYEFEQLICKPDLKITAFQEKCISYVSDNMIDLICNWKIIDDVYIYFNGLYDEYNNLLSISKLDKEESTANNDIGSIIVAYEEILYYSALIEYLDKTGLVGKSRSDLNQQSESF